jgi:hypothetical protein
LREVKNDLRESERLAEMAAAEETLAAAVLGSILRAGVKTGRSLDAMMSLLSCGYDVKK